MCIEQGAPKLHARRDATHDARESHWYPLTPKCFCATHIKRLIPSKIDHSKLQSLQPIICRPPKGFCAHGDSLNLTGVEDSRLQSPCILPLYSVSKMIHLMQHLQQDPALLRPRYLWATAMHLWDCQLLSLHAVPYQPKKMQARCTRHSLRPGMLDWLRKPN